MTDEAVRDRLDAEITALRAEYDALDAQLFSIQDPADEAWSQIVTALRKGVDPPIEADRAYDSYHSQTMAVFATQKNLRDRLAALSTESEYERRLQDAARGSGPAKPKRESAGPKLTARDRGVPDVYLADNGNFRVGMDARYKSDLILSALGLPAPDGLMTFDPADAEARLADRDWTKFLDRKREKLEGGKA